MFTRCGTPSLYLTLATILIVLVLFILTVITFKFLVPGARELAFITTLFGNVQPLNIIRRTTFVFGR